MGGKLNLGSCDQCFEIMLPSWALQKHPKGISPDLHYFQVTCRACFYSEAIERAGTTTSKRTATLNSIRLEAARSPHTQSEK